jgi:hypothetical protein
MKNSKRQEKTCDSHPFDPFITVADKNHEEGFKRTTSNTNRNANNN